MDFQTSEDEQRVLRIAFFGGSFDPPHRGHLAIAHAAAERLGLDRVLFAPVARQALKVGQQAIPVAHRYAMVALATAGHPRFVPSLIDATESPTPNYTVDTLTRLRADLDRAAQPYRLFNLLGADSFSTLARWREAEKLLQLCDWIVAARPGSVLAGVDDLALALPAGFDLQPATTAHPQCQEVLRNGRPVCRIHVLSELAEDVSATRLREELAAGHARLGDMPDAVLEYISKLRLYQSSGARHYLQHRG